MAAMLAALLFLGLLQPAVNTLVDRFLTPETEPLASYRAIRHLHASTRNGKFSADMDVVTSLDPEHGFSFEIVSQSGSALVRRRVLLEALLTEQRMVSAQASRETALTRANYEFLNVADADAPALTVRARRKIPMLVNGTLFLDDDAELTRLEGELAEKPSFWTRRVHVIRRYDHIASVHVPVEMASVADIRIVGASHFQMSYRYLEINGQQLEPRQ